MKNAVCILFAILLFSFSILIYVLPMEKFSESENRMLADLPSIRIEELWSGDTMKEVSRFYADRFPCRALLLRLKSISELVALKGENGDVFFGKDMYLVKRLEQIDTLTLEENRQAADTLASWLSASGKPTALVYAPRAIDVLGSKLPALYPKETAAKAYEILPRSPLTDVLAKKAERGEGVWYHTDHHWSTLGAYVAYSYFGETLGYTPYPIEAFHTETVCHEFFGTSASASLFPFTSPDSITLYRFPQDQALICTDLSTGQTREGLYDFEKLETADQYSVFLGGNFAHIRIEMPNEKRPLLLIVKDSYANALVPFLARHYDIEMIDTRYLRTPCPELLEEIMARDEYAGALLLWNIETLSDKIGLEMLLPRLTS